MPIRDDIFNVLDNSPKQPFTYQSPADSPSRKQEYTPTLGNNEQNSLSFEDIMKLPLGTSTSGKRGGLGTSVSDAELKANQRYSEYSPLINNEDVAGWKQSSWDQAANGVMKGLNLAATTVLGSGAMIYGMGKWISGGQFNDVFNNEASRELDNWNKQIEDILPNYYTNQQQDASWYSRDNWFTTNFLFDKFIKNAGFAVGAIYSGNVFGGLATKGASALASGLYSAANSTQKWNSLSKILTNSSRLLSQGKNLEVAQALEKTLLNNKTAEGLANFTDELAKLAKTTNTISSISDNTRRGIMSMYGIGGEAAFEAIGAQTEFKEHLIREFERVNGRAPEGEELKVIENESQLVGNSAFVLNSLLLSATQYVQLPKLLGTSYKAERAAANGFLQNTDNVVFDETKKAWATAPKSRLMKLYRGVQKVPFSPMESFEEVSQSAISFGVNDYYGKKYSGESADVLNSLIDAYSEVLSSKEGGEAFLLGGLTGGLMQWKEDIKNHRQKGINTQGLISEMNSSKSMSDFMKATIDSVARGVKLNVDQENATIQGDQLQVKDLETDSMINYLSPRIKYGRYDLVQDDINKYRQLSSTQEGLEKLKIQGEAAQNDTIESYQTRLAKFEESAKAMKEINESLNLRYSGIMKDDKRVYDNKTIDLMTYSLMKIRDYDQRIPSVLQPVLQANVGFQSLIDLIKSKASDKELDKDYTRATEEILALNIPNEAKDTLFENLTDAIELTKRREEMIAEYDKLQTAPEDYKEEVLTTDASVKADVSKTIKLKTFRGEQDLAIGEEYYLGSVVKKSKEGKPIFEFPIFTILGLNEDGTVKVRAKNGNVRNVPANSFETYKLGRVSTINKFPEAKFYFRHINQPMFKRLKGGKEIPGSLAYDSETNELFFEYLTLKGKERREKISLESFNPKKGYTKGLYYLGKAWTPEDVEDFKKPSYSKAQVMEGRLKVFEELTDEAENNLKEIKDKISAREKELNNTNKQLKELRDKVEKEYRDAPKKGVFRTAIRNAIKSIYQLEKTKKNLESEILNLQSDAQEVESNLSYFYDAIDNIEEMSDNISDVVDDLYTDIQDLENLQNQIQFEQKVLSGLISKIQKALDSAIDLVLNLINKFEKKYPNLPTSVAEVINSGNRVKNSQSPEDYNNYISELRDFEDELSQIEDLDIVPSERHVSELAKKIDELEQSFKEVQKEINAKEEIIRKFEKKIYEYRQAKKLKEDFAKNEGFQKEFFGKLETEVSDGTPTGTDEGDLLESKGHDPRLPLLHVRFRMTSHTAKPADGPDTRSKQIQRFERFTNNLDRFSPELRGVLKVIPITINNEESIGLKGFIESTIDETQGFDKDKLANTDIGIIQWTVVKTKGDEYFYINEKGEEVGKVGEPIEFDKIIHDTLSSTSLTYSSGDLAGKNRFVDKNSRATPAEYQAAAKVYRQELLSKTSITHADIRNFSISVGVPEKNITVVDGKNKYEFNALDETMISTQDLISDPGIIKVSTGEEIVSSGYNRKLPAGRPYLKKGTTLEYLHNRNFSVSEAENLFEVIKEFAKKSLVGKEWDSALLRYLKGQLYIRQPKGDAVARNQMYFDFENAEFVIGKNQVRIPFNLEGQNAKQYKDRFIAYLTGVYNNIDNKTLSSEDAFQEFYVENGQLKSRLWKNYRTFLASSKFIDVEGNESSRGSKPLLGTSVRKINHSVENDYVFKNKYMIVEEESALFSDKEPIKKVDPVTPKAPVQPTQKQKSTKESTSNKFKLVQNGKTLIFEKVDEAITVLKEEDYDFISAAFIKSRRITEFKNKYEELSKLSDEEVAPVFIENFVRGNIDKSEPISVEQETSIFTQEFKTPGGLVLKYENVGTPGSPIIVLDENWKDYKIQSDKLKSTGKFNDEQVKNFITAQITAVLEEGSNTYEAPDSTVSNTENGNFKVNNDPDEPVFKKVPKRFADNLITENQWKSFEEWLSKNLPQIKLERVKHLISTTDGGAAFGRLKNNLISVYEKAEQGTEFHEAFEAVWKFFAPAEEKLSIYKEFLNRKGSFVEASTGKTIKYSDATFEQAKEEIADEFGKYMRDKVIPQKVTGNKILKFFVDLFRFIKELFSQPKVIDQMFKKINEGYYTDNQITDNKVSDIKQEYSRIGNLSAELVHALNQDMTHEIFTKIFRENRSFFELVDNNLKASEIYKEIKDKFMSKMPITEEEFAALKLKNQKFLRSYGITIDDETDSFEAERNERGQSDYARDAFRVDIHNSNFAIKLLYATLPKTKYEYSDAKKTSIGQKIKKSLKANLHDKFNTFQLEDRSKLFMQTLQSMYDKPTFNAMIEALVNRAQIDPSFALLAQRMKVNVSEGTVNFDALTSNDWRLLINWYSTFSKQQPQGIILYSDEEGGLYSESSDLNTTDLELIHDWIENIKSKSKIIEYVKGEGYKPRLDILNKYKTSSDKGKYLNFLNDIGISISKPQFDTFTVNDKETVESAAATILAHFTKDSIKNLSANTLGVKQSLVRISKVVNKYSNPTYSAVVYGSERQAKQKFVQHNYLSVFTNTFNAVKTLEELFNLRPELTEMFRSNSEFLRKGGEYFNTDGTKTGKKLAIGYFDGMVGNPVDKMEYNDRLISELNMNTKGRYYVLVPADSATEWFTTLGNKFDYSSMRENLSVWNSIYSQFKKYFQDEANLIINKKSLNLSDEAAKKADKLRFFEDILSPKVKEKFYKEVDSTKFDFDTFYKANEAEIQESIKNFIDIEANSLQTNLESYFEIYKGEKGWNFQRLDKDFANDKLGGRDLISDTDIQALMRFFAVNYVVNNIEYHKLLFGDPANFKDEIKRIKVFLSPRGRTFDSEEFRAWANKSLNNDLKPSDLGYKTYSQYFKTSVVKDFKILSQFVNDENFKKKFPKLYDMYNDGEIESTDGSAWSNPIFAREFKIRNGDWTDKDEEFYQFDMASFRFDHAAQLMKVGRYSEALQQKDKKLLDSYKGKEPLKPQEVFKPIVSGVNTSNNTVLHKYSIMPMYYSIVKGYDIGEKMLMKMLLENIDYNIVGSGAKVGTKGQFDLFENDKFTSKSYNNIQEISWEYLGKQVETIHHEKQQTRGSQLTKLATMNLMELGETSPETRTMIDRHDSALDRMTEFGYQTLLKKLGITESIDASNNAYYEIPDKRKLLEFFEDVILPMNPDDNILELLSLKDGEFAIPFESTNTYQRIKNILLAQVDKNIMSPKLNGGPKVQITSLPFNTVGLEFYYKKGKSWVKADGLQPKDAKLVPTSNALKFYSNDGGKTQRAEILIPIWFRDELKASSKFKNMTDAQLLEYINKNSPSILEAIGFRIPTQELSSVDAFVVKGFLNESAGNTVVVPAELVKKAGSDFDIDKMNTYLKNIYINEQGDLVPVPKFNSLEEAKDFLRNEVIKEFFTKVDEIKRGKNLDEMDKLPEEDNLLSIAEELYQKSLENEYFDSIGELLLLEQNFERLLTPNSGGQELKDLRTQLVNISKAEFESSSSSLLSRDYMSKQRHFFIIGKRGVGIAAVAQVGNALAQRTNIYMDQAKVALAAEEYYGRFLGNGEIKLTHNKDLQGRTTLSKIKDKASKFISNKISYYIDGFVDIAKDPFIVQLGIDMNTAGTFLFLERIGVPTNKVVYFMNQPIVRQALKVATINKKRVTSLNADDIMSIEGAFGESAADTLNEGALLDNIKKFYEGKDNLDFYQKVAKLTAEEKAQQVLILREFLKYSTMATHLFKFTQATTYDTARFTDMALFDRKKFATDSEMKNNIFSSPEKIIESGHLSKIVDSLNGAQSALGTILKFEEGTIKSIIDKTKDLFIQKQFVSNEDVVIASNKVTASFIDYVFQTSAKFKHNGKEITPNGMISTLSKDGKSIQALEFLKNDPRTKDNLFVKQLTTKINPEAGGKYVLFKNKDNSTDTRNSYIASIAELLDSDDSTVRGYTKDILLAGMLQFGTYKKPNSFTDLIPIANYSNFVRSAMDNMNYATLDNYNELKAFWRNNWKDEEIVPKMNKLIKWEDQMGYTRYAFPAIDFQPKELIANNLLSLSTTFNKKELSSPVVLVERVKPEYIRNKQARKEMSARGDYSYLERTLYQVVMTDGKPLSYYTEYKGKEDIKIVYKKINAWGDGINLQEYYNSPQQSIINNGTEKMTEVDDQTIVNTISSIVTIVDQKTNKDPFTC